MKSNWRGLFMIWGVLFTVHGVNESEGFGSFGFWTMVAGFFFISLAMMPLFDWEREDWEK